jgi:hypothetical protein
MEIPKPKSVGSKIAATLGLIATILGIILGVRALIPPAKPPQLSAVFILDVSPAMRQELGGTTKLAAAQNRILQIIAGFPGVSTSLRLVTTGCEATYKPPTVDFATNNGDRYANVFRDLASERVSTYVEGLNSATNDLTTKKLIEDSKEKLLVAFVADARKCRSALPFPVAGDLRLQLFWLGGSPGALAEIRRQLEDLGFTDVNVRKIANAEELNAVDETVKARSDAIAITPKVRITVPTVTGLSFPEATAKLQASGLLVTLLGADSPPSSRPVVAQVPPAGKLVPPGTTVALTLAPS